MVSILIPFTIAPSLIPIIWGRDTLLWYEAGTTVLLNLIHGLVSNTVLALFIAFLTYQYDLLKDELSYRYDIQNIILLCHNAVERQDVNQLLHVIELHQKKSFLLLERPYKTCFLHSRKSKEKIQSSTEKIEYQIERIKEECQDIMNVERRSNKLLTYYNRNFAKMLYYPHYTKKYKEHQKKVAELSRDLDRCQEGKNKKIQGILEPITELNAALEMLKDCLRCSSCSI